MNASNVVTPRARPDPRADDDCDGNVDEDSCNTAGCENPCQTCNETTGICANDNTNTCGSGDECHSLVCQSGQCMPRPENENGACGPEDSNDCTRNQCTNGECTAANTQGDNCRINNIAGQCNGGACNTCATLLSTTCSDDNPCTTHTCNSSTCSVTNNNAPCPGGTCVNGACDPCNGACVEGEVCTDQVCVPTYDKVWNDVFDVSCRLCHGGSRCAPLSRTHPDGTWFS